MFNLSEVFYSIQGEGPKAGTPSIFVRLSGCNLRCKWGDNLCDTSYTSWDPETELVSAEEVVARVRAANDVCRQIVLTGGEPTLFEGLGGLCVTLKNLGYSIDLETNGTGMVSDGVDLIVCSPKLSDSTPVGSKFESSHEVTRKKLHYSIRGDDSRLFLKFVISPKSNFSEVFEIVKALRIPKERVYLMPEGVTAEQVSNNSPFVWECAIEHGFKFSSRLHILLFGARRGV